MPLHVRVQRGPSSGTTVILNRFPAVAGRAPECDVRLSGGEGKPTVSRRHLEIDLRNGRIVVRDVSSTGTWIGQQRLAAGQEVVVAAGQAVWLGPQTMLTLELLGEKPAAAEDGSALVTTDNIGSLQPAAVLAVHALDFPHVPRLPEESWRSRKALLLFLYLVHHGRPVAATKIQTDLWPDTEDAAAAVHTSVSRIRRALREAAGLDDSIRMERGLYSLNPAIVIQYDVQQFQQALGEASHTVDVEVRSHVRPGGLDPHTVVVLMEQVMAGAAHAHSLGIIHRDLKPENVMVTPDQRIKILDFGLACGEAEATISHGTTFGTPAYTPPERILEPKIQPQPALDQYSSVS